MRRLLPSFALLVALLPASVASDPTAEAERHGECPPTEEASAPPLFYSTTTVVERALASATAAVRVIERREIASASARTLGEVLALVPGLHVISNGSRAGHAAAQLRGGDPNLTLVLVDGVPVNDLTDTEGGGFDLNGLSVEAIERVEVVAGPLSAHFGSTALAGALHIISRRAADDAPPTGRLRGRLGIESGGASMARVHGGVSRSALRGAYSGGLHLERENGRIGDDRFEQADLHLAAEVDLTPTRRLRLNGRLARREAGDYPDASGGPLLGDGALRSSDHEEAAAALDLLLGRADRTRWRLHGAYFRLTRDRTSPAVGVLVPASVEAASFARERLGAALDRALGRELRLSAGLDVTREGGRVDSLLELAPFLGGAVQGDYDVERTVGGVFGNLLWQRDRLTLEVASRIDLPEGGGSEISPRLGAAWALGPSTRLRASAGRAFKLPGFFALASPPALGGNPDLAPEKGLGFDLALEYALADVEIEIGVFLNRFRDLVDFDFDRFTHVNRASIEAYGTEMAAQWRPSRGIRLSAALTLQRVEDRDQKTPVLHRPEALFTLSSSWEPKAGVILSLGARHVSGSHDRQLTVPHRDSVEGYLLLNGAASWAVTPALEVDLRAGNVTGTAYETLIGFPGPGRSLSLGLRWRR